MVLAAVVAFAAVAGALYLADWILGGPEQEPRKEGYLALITFGEGEEERPAERRARPARRDTTAA